MTKMEQKIHTVPMNLLPFIKSNIATKLGSYFKVEPIDTALKALQESSAIRYDQVELAKVLTTDLKIPLNNEDIAVIFHILTQKGAVLKKTLAEYLVNPLAAPIKEAWTENAADKAAPSSVRSSMAKGMTTGKTDLGKSQKEEKWEAKARSIYAKYKEAKEDLEKSERQKKELEYKMQTICKDPKQKQIFELQRRIEILEGVVNERDAYIRKTLGNTNELEMTVLKRNVEIEKAELMQMIANKNKEILMFKSELDAVLSSMNKLRKKKKNAS